MKQTLQSLAVRTVDLAIALIPRSTPDEAALRNCKIVSHRGEHDNFTIMENTLPAFDKARLVGVAGLECDIRWTKDHVPVICHDATLERVFGLPVVISEIDFARLRERAPMVPSLSEMVHRYGGENHLMLEIKSIEDKHLDIQRQRLSELLAGLRPAQDFHILALDPALFQVVDSLPPHCLLPVAELNVATLSKISLQRGYAGLAGHYLLLNERIKKQHQSAGQWIGTGFPRSRNALLREVNRGVEWIFTNHAVALQQELRLLHSEALPNRPPVQ